MIAYHEQRHYTGSCHLTINKAHEFDFLAHYHDEYEIFFVIDGVQNLGVNNQILQLSAGQIGLVAPWHIHYYEKDRQSEAAPLKGFMLIFSADILGCRLPQHSLLWSFDRQDKRFLELTMALEALHQEMAEQAAYYALSASGLLQSFMAGLLRSAGSAKVTSICADSQNQHMLTQNMLSYIAGHAHEQISRNGLARQFGISPSHFSRLFKSATGLSLCEYMARLRIARARKMLKDSTGSITEIALDCGFTSIRTFNRCFQRIIGCPPSLLRRQDQLSEAAGGTAASGQPAQAAYLRTKVSRSSRGIGRPIR